MGVNFQKLLTGGSLGFDVPAAVEKLKLTPEGTEDLGDLWNRVFRLANPLAWSKVKPPIL